MPQGQLYTIVEGRALLTRCESLCFLHLFRPENQREPVGFESGSLQLEETLLFYETQMPQNPRGSSPNFASNIKEFKRTN